MATSYGALIVDQQGRVLLRSVANMFGGAKWTFPKGRRDPGESPEETAIREALEETGHKIKILSAVPGEFAGTTTTTGYFMAESVADTGKHDTETDEVRWVPLDEAHKLITQSPSKKVVDRDLQVLAAAKAEYAKIQEARKRAAIPPAVQKGLTTMWSKLDKVAPRHKQQIVDLSKRLIAELEGKMQKLAGSPEKYATTATASKLLQLHALAERLGYDHGQAMGTTLAQQGTQVAGIAREALVKQVNDWADAFPGSTERLVAPDLASALLDEGLLERYEVSKRTYGMEAIGKMRTEMAAGALNGESLAVTWKRVAAKVQIEDWRAERIVRTEHSFAVHRRQIEDLRDVFGGEPDPKTGIRKVDGWWKQLVATFDNRTADDSRFVHGQRRRLDRPFKDDKDREYQHPPNRPNDREVVIFVPDKAAKTTKKKAEAAVAPTDPKAWPADPHKLKTVGKLGGSTGAELVEDERGQRFVRKKVGPRLAEGHIRSEAMADDVYRATGLNVPDGKLYETQQGPVKLTRFVDGAKPLGSLSGAERARAEAELRKGFAVDAALGNWDVVGMGHDNVLCSPDGSQVWRIDNGGSLGYRAQGTRKTAAQWSPEPHDLWTLRDRATAAQAGPIFDKLGWDEIVAQQRELLQKQAAIDKVIADHAKAAGTSPAAKTLNDDGWALRHRLATMHELTEVSATMRADRFKPGYVDEFMKHKMGLRAVLDLPSELKADVKRATIAGATRAKDVPFEYQGVSSLKDENGKLFDELRGKNQRAFEDYLRRIGSVEVIKEYAGAQAGSSWSSKSVAMKHAVAKEMREAPASSYLWRGQAETTGEREWRAIQQRVGSQKAIASVAAQHALTHEILTTVRMHPIDAAKGTVRIFRTEGTYITSVYNCTRDPTKLQTMTRGALESGSLVKPVSPVAGSELTIQHVPIHRVFATYLHNRPGSGSSMFLGDGENEAVVIFDEQIKFIYPGRNPL